jgi:hypothetical protein
MTSLYKDFYGDQMRWFVGTVTTIQDPLELGRAKIRVDGIHVDDPSLIPPDALPWAQCMVPITQGGTNEYGNNLGIQVGSRVFGLFLDGKHSQMPMIMGTLPKFESESPSGKSTNRLATGTNTITKTPDTVTSEPESPYAAVYPHNKVTATTSGHVVEIDDTPDAERIHIYHKSGTFVEMHPNGDVVTQHKNGFRTVTGNDKLHVTGNLDITVDGNMNLTVAGELQASATSGDVVVDSVSLVTHTHRDNPGLAGAITTPPLK